MEKFYKFLRLGAEYLQIGGFLVCLFSIFLEFGWLFLSGAVAIGLGIYLLPIVKKWEAQMIIKEELFRSLIEGKSARSGLISAAGKMGVNTEHLHFEVSNIVDINSLAAVSNVSDAEELPTNHVNRVFLIGKVVTEPEVRYLEWGEPVFNYCLETERIFDEIAGKFDGNEFHQIKQFGEISENQSTPLMKGDQVYIQGVIRTRKLNDPNVIEKYVTYIYTNEVKRLIKYEKIELCRAFE